MANNLVSMQYIRVIIQHLINGLSHRKIALELSICRNTINEYVGRLKASGYSLEDLQKLDDANLSTIIYAHAASSKTDLRAADFKTRVPRWLSELTRTGVHKLLLWQEYKIAYPEGYEYSQFCELFAAYQKVKNASMHFEHQPGILMMVDFAGSKLSYINKSTGELIECPVFVCVLPFSGMSYVMALPDQKQPSVIKALNNSINYFGGVPQSIKFDNMKQAVSKSSRYEPIFTDTMQQWGLHNNITLLAARPRKPKDKPHVEAAVNTAYQRIYAPIRDEVFYSLDQLNKAILKHQLIHHEKKLQRKNYNRKNYFNNEEYPLLRALPQNAYEIKHVAKAKVQKNYHVILGEDWHFYSVPFNYIGKQVTAVYDADTVEIYYEHRRIALHRRSFKPHGYTTITEHMPESHQRYHEQQGWRAEDFLLQAKNIGIVTHAYIQKVLNRGHFVQQNYTICIGIFRLSKSYGNDRIEAACKRALRGTVYNYNTILNILNRNLDKVETEESTLLFTMPKHENIRGASSYQ